MNRLALVTGTMGGRSIKVAAVQRLQTPVGVGGLEVHRGKLKHDQRNVVRLWERPRCYDLVAVVNDGAEGLT